MTPRRRAAINDFTIRLVQMKAEAFTLGLFRTGHALDCATKAVGWETADILTGRQVDLDPARRPERRTRNARG